MKMLFIQKVAILWLLSGTLFGQADVVLGEWFFDGPDPGIGNATVFNNFTPDTQIVADIQASVNTLSPGLHYWNVRVKNSLGIWSHTYMRPFVVLARDSASELQAGEWFWDTDPGYGAGQAYGLSGHRDTASLSIPVDVLPAGIHTLFTRARNAEGHWSHTYQRNTFVKAEPQAKLEKITYFFRSPTDTTTTYTFPLSQPQHYIDLTFAPDTSDLMNNTTYDFCLQVVRTDSVVSCDTCQSYSFTGSTTDLEGLLAASWVQVYPNPNQGSFQVALPGSRFEAAMLRVFDVQGKKIFSKDVAPTDPAVQVVSLNKLTTGMYMLVVEMGARVIIKRVIIKD
ncbi:MAG: T9SS type A sorting domain-containing protein [Bacteroidota bacterium]